MDRRVAIADTAIDVLASSGARGLTHRSVDRRLDLPDGSTSYYFRTRSALLAAASNRLVELDRADVEATRPDAAAIARLVELWLQPANRHRLIARFETFLSASRSPEEPVLAARAEFRALVARSFSAAGANDPTLASAALIATLDGLLLDGLLGQTLDPEQRGAIVEAAIGSALRAATPGTPDPHERSARP